MPKKPRSMTNPAALRFREREITSLRKEPIDADGIMIRAAAKLGEYHAERGFKPYLTWLTDARNKAYRQAYQAASASLRERQS